MVADAQKRAFSPKIGGSSKNNLNTMVLFTPMRHSVDMLSVAEQALNNRAAHVDSAVIAYLHRQIAIIAAR